MNASCVLTMAEREELRAEIKRVWLDPAVAVAILDVVTPAIDRILTLREQAP